MNGIIQTIDIGYGSYVVIENDLIGRCIKHHGYWEPHLFNIYNNIILDTDIVLDAGANIGFHTINMARKAKHVYAFEPQKLIYNLLSTNILINNLTDKTTQYRWALSDQHGKMKMQPLNQFDEQDGTHNYGGRGITNKESDGEDIEIKTFDSLKLDIDVIKIDIQGSEIYAFKGMIETIKRNRPWIMLENYEYQDNDEKVLEFLDYLDYDVYRLQNTPREDCIAVHRHNNKHYELIQLLNNELKDFYKKDLTKKSSNI